MANTIYSQGDKVEYGIKIYYVDTEADKTNLPKRSAKMGSKCYVIEDKKWYILNGSYEWVPFVDAGGSGGSGSPFVPKGSVATVDELPTEDNAIGDLYIVREDHSEWVWLTSSEEPDGYWEKIGESLYFIVEVLYEDNKYIANKTYAEIEKAYNAGKIIILYYDGRIYSLNEVIDKEFWFTYCLSNMSSIKIYSFVLYDSNILELYDKSSAINPTKIYVNDSDAVIAPERDIYYHCGELTSLTITNPTITGSYSIVFTSGATATTTTIPSTILGLEDFAAEANTMYEINVLDNRAVVGSWAVTV